MTNPDRFHDQARILRLVNEVRDRAQHNRLIATEDGFEIWQSSDGVFWRIWYDAEGYRQASPIVRKP